MILKTYGIFDSIQGEYVRTFTASKDDEAKRAAEYVVRDKGFDDISGKDRSIHYLYSMDTETGLITDNNVHIICNLSTFIEGRKQEVLQNQIQSKLMDETFVKELKETLLNQLKGEVLDGLKQSSKN